MRSGKPQPLAFCSIDARSSSMQTSIGGAKQVVTPPSKYLSKLQSSMAGIGKQPEKVVNITQLNLNQLDQLKTQLEEELGIFTQSMTQLKIVQQKLKRSKDSISELSDGKEVLVPMTSSVYIPGKLKDSNKLICDIGTGYYVEKSPKQAEEYFERRIQFVTTNLENIQKALREKHRMREEVVNVMQVKMQAQFTRQKQSMSKS